MNQEQQKAHFHSLVSTFNVAEGIDIEKLANDLVGMFLMQSYQAQQFGNKDQMMVQLKKGGEFQALLGMQAALTVTMRRSPGGVLAVIGQQKWVDKAAAGAVGMLILWPLAFTAGAGAVRQANLATEVLNTLDSLVRQQNSTVQVNVAPEYMLAQVQQQPMQPYAQPMPQQGAPVAMPQPYQPPVKAPVQYQPPLPPAAYMQQPVNMHLPEVPGGELRCPQCNAPHRPGDIYCVKCGHLFLVEAPKQYCASCGAEMQPGATFCATCGIGIHGERRPVQASRRAPDQEVENSWGRLVFSDGRHNELVGERVTIGRSSQEAARNKFFISLQDLPEQATVSHKHALMEHTGDACLLTDLNSTNGTFVNGKALEAGRPEPIHNGDKLAFGKVICTFNSTQPVVQDMERTVKAAQPA